MRHPSSFCISSYCTVYKQLLPNLSSFFITLKLIIPKIAHVSWISQKALWTTGPSNHCNTQHHCHMTTFTWFLFTHRAPMCIYPQFALHSCTAVLRLYFVAVVSVFVSLSLIMFYFCVRVLLLVHSSYFVFCFCIH